MSQNHQPLRPADIPTVPGHFSLLDCPDHVLATEEGRALLARWQPVLLPNAKGTLRPGQGILRMFGRSTLLNLSSMVGMMGVKVTREQLLAINQELCAIPKP